MVAARARLLKIAEKRMLIDEMRREELLILKYELLGGCWKLMLCTWSSAVVLLLYSSGGTSLILTTRQLSWYGHIAEPMNLGNALYSGTASCKVPQVSCHKSMTMVPFRPATNNPTDEARTNCEM